MTPGSVLRRYLLYGIIGSAVVAVCAPFLRIGLTALALKKSDALLAQSLPGPALCHLRRVRLMAPDYPLFAGRVRTEMVRGYVRIGDLGSAVRIVRDEPRAASTSRIDLARAVILRYPNIAANALLTRYFGAAAETSPVTTLREELQRAATPEAHALLQAMQPTANDVASVNDSHAPTFTLPSDENVPEPTTTEAGYATPPPTIPDFVTSRPPISADPTTPTRPPPERPNAQWAVVSAPQARTYTRAGKFVGKIEAGTVADVVDVTTSTVGDLAVCLLQSGPLQDKEFVIRTTELDILPGSVSTVSESERKLRVTRAQLSAALAERKSELEQQQEARNPHAREYARAKEAYIKFWKDVKRLTTLRDNSEGAKRVRYGDELRRMKDEDGPLGDRYRSTKAKYEAWNAANGKSVNLDADSTAQRICTQIATIDAKLEQIN